MPQRRPLFSWRDARRRVALYVTAPALAILAACSDVGPTAPASAPGGAALLSKGSKAAAAQVDTIVYDGRARTLPFGDGHKVEFAANAVCDPATSGYGIGLWDTPCAPATAPIRFIVTSWRDANGRAQVDFSPDVRFVPGTVETLYLNDNPGKAKRATIQWCASATLCVDESLTDPTLATRISAGRVERRIKHFSGYNVVFGFGDSGSGL